MANFTDKVRAVLAELSQQGDTVSASEIAKGLGLDTGKAKRPMYGVIGDLKRLGELKPTEETGVYRYIPMKKALVRTVMWRILRSRRSVTLEDLQELAGASHEYAKRWTRMLEKRGIVKKMKSGAYRLIEDPVDEPVDTDRIKWQRDWRKKREQALSALDDVSAAIDRARKALKEN